MTMPSYHCKIKKQKQYSLKSLYKRHFRRLCTETIHPEFKMLKRGSLNLEAKSKDKCHLKAYLIHPNASAI